MGKVHLPSGHRQAWQAAQGRPRWTYDEIVAATGLTYGQVQKLVARWGEAGAVRAVSVRPDRRTEFAVTDPEAFADAAVTEAAPRVQSDVGNMWTAMRAMATFSPVDLAAQASTEEIEVTLVRARDYCGVLLRHGYLKVVRKAVPGVREPIYRLIRNTGPVAPREKRVTVIEDINVGQRGRA